MDHDHPEFQQLLGKARDAAAGGRESWDVQSTGEKLAVALVLNRADWLESVDYTIAEAIARVGSHWVAMIPEVAEVIRSESHD